MGLGRGEYCPALSAGGILEERYVDNLLGAMASRLRIEEVPPELFRSSGHQAKITEQLSRLSLRVARGPRSWQGLVIGFPGNDSQLNTKTLGTPYLGMLLYPILGLQGRMNAHDDEDMRCLDLLGCTNVLQPPGVRPRVVLQRPKVQFGRPEL